MCKNKICKPNSVGSNWRSNYLIIFFILVLVIYLPGAKAQQVSASFTPSTIELGQASTLTVSVGIGYCDYESTPEGISGRIGSGSKSITPAAVGNYGVVFTCIPSPPYGQPQYAYSELFVLPSSQPPGEYSGFNSKYMFSRGDLNGDSKLDIYIRQNPQESSPAPVNDFILRNNGDGSFTKINPTASQRIVAGGWLNVDIPSFISDIDFNGKADLTLSNLSDFVPGAHDQIIFSSKNILSPPAQVTALSPSVKSFSREVSSWLLDPDYFDDNAPLKVISSSEPATRTYFGTSFGSYNVLAINWLLAQCELAGYECGVTSLDPAQCIRGVDIYNQFGDYVGTDIVNVCLYSTHVFRYEENTVNFVKSYEYFNQSALEFAAEVESVMPGGVEDIENTDPILVRVMNEVLKSILKGEFGDDIFENDPDMDEMKSTLIKSCQKKFGHGNIEHPYVPHDDQYSTTNPSYHHYDVQTKICINNQYGCTNTAVNNILRLFSYPSKKLQPVQTPLDGYTEILVYFALPSQVSFPDAYDSPYILGEVTQTEYTQTTWQNPLIQNTTTPLHLLHPGKITRTIEDKDGSKFIMTHGIGHNDRGTLLDVLAGGTIDYQSSQALNMILGCMNDIYGPKTFQTLDIQAKKYWKAQYQTQSLITVPLAATSFTADNVELTQQGVMVLAN